MPAFTATCASALQTAKSAAVGVWAYTLTAAATRLATMAPTRARVTFRMEHLLKASHRPTTTDFTNSAAARTHDIPIIYI